MNHKVGIVIVSYNASMAVRITLASLRQAKNKTPAKVVLIDNASDDLEREKIRSAFERHVQETSLPWEYIQQEKNLGFSGGNNVGIRHLLDDPEVSHICLLNSDVIVTDYWLDHLVAARCDIISTVTNKADSEQCVPVDYSLEPNECLDERTESVPSRALARVETFAQNWREAWTGNLVEADVTFFCVLLATPVLHKVGLLDETFFPGGYEDDDFCMRAHQLGYRIHLARDLFIHHWGSASFGQLQYEYFNNQAQRNRDYLEKKHGISWNRRPEKPFVSYLMDLRFACTRDGKNAARRRYNTLYTTNLGSALEHYESEFKNLSNMVTNSGQEVLPALHDQIAQAVRFGNLVEDWQSIVSESDAFFVEQSGPRVSVEDLLARLKHVVEGIHVRVKCNFAMHASLFPSKNETVEVQTPPPLTSEAILSPDVDRSRIGKIWWLLKRGLPFLWNLRGIVFFGGYPYPERQSDGYFQRIQIVDGLFPDRWRVYVESDELVGRNLWFDRPQPKVLVLRIQGSRRRRALVRTLALLAVLKCRKVYFHSVLRMHDNRFGLLMHVPGLTKVIDIHGVVPEEFRLHNDFYSAVLYEAEERLAVRKSDMVLVVTEAMQNYLRQKYREDLRGKVAIFPIFPNIAPTLAPRAYVDGKPVIVYAGGLHKWQQVPKMIDAISRTSSVCAHRFYCPEPEVLRAMLPEVIRAQLIVECKAHEELISLYAECHYGFILREDIIVNHAACPTKLIEYLAMGIVPIVDCENMGDFKSMGMQFVPLNDLLQGNLPNEAQRAEMAQQNFVIYERLREVRKQGARDISDLLAGDRQQHDTRPALLPRIKGLLPHDTQRGRLARSLWHQLRALATRDKAAASAPGRAREETRVQTVDSIMPECDVLVQVDNFEAGGLENVVLDLNDTLIGAGYKVVLLVLGTAGAGVQQARERGMVVVIGSAEKELYRELIERLKPRMLLTHYSLHGAELCHELGLPFVQVIHNIYMWFDRAQQAAFAHAARFTTAFVAVSEYAKHYSILRLGVEEERCIVIPNGIDSASFDAFDKRKARLEIRSKHGLGDQDFVFLSVGAINHQKNHIATVRAFATVAEELPRAKLVIVGPVYEQNLLEEIQHFITAQALGGRVTYAGAMSGAQKYYAMADAFVSTAFFEGGGLNHMEAARANLPSIMTNVGYAREFEGVPGFEILVGPLDIAVYKGAIWQLSSTPEFDMRLAAAMVWTYKTRQSPDLPSDVLDAFDNSCAYQCYVELIGDLLHGKGVQGKNFPSSWPNRLAVMRSERICATA